MYCTFVLMLVPQTYRFKNKSVAFGESECQPCLMSQSLFYFGGILFPCKIKHIIKKTDCLMEIPLSRLFYRHGNRLLGGNLIAVTKGGLFTVRLKQMIGEDECNGILFYV